MQQKSNLPSINKTGLQIAKVAYKSLSLINQLLEEGNPEYWYEKATKAKEQKDWEAAFYFYSKAVQLNNKENKYLLPKGYCAMKTSKTEIAANSLIHAFKNRKGNFYDSFVTFLSREEWRGLQAYFNLLNDQEYTIIFTIALLEFPYVPNADLYRGLKILNSLSDEQKYLNPDYFELTGFLNRKCGAFPPEEDLRSAKKDYDILISLEPNNARGYFDRGYTFYLLGCNELENSVSESWRGQEFVDKALKEFTSAIYDFTTCIELDPKYDCAYLNRGLAYYNLKEFKLAINDYSIYIKLNPNNADGYFNRGMVYYELKEFPLAINDCTKVINDCTEGLDLPQTRNEANYIRERSLHYPYEQEVERLPIF